MRVLNRMTQTDLAKFLHISQSSYSKIERSNTVIDELSYSDLHRLADLFQIDLSTFIETLENERNQDEVCVAPDRLKELESEIANAKKYNECDIKRSK